MPISLTSFLLKTLEKLLDLHIRNDVGRLMSSNQHAYTKGKSVETALHSLVVTVERAPNIKEYALGVFVDISGASINVKTDAIMDRLEATNRHPALDKKPA